jgi:hypothetical protein
MTHTAGPSHVTFASTADNDLSVPVNTNNSFNPDNWLQEPQLAVDWSNTIDPNLVTHQTIGQTLPLSTIPDIAVTPSDLSAIRRECRCASHRHLYDSWPTRDAELFVGTCMRQCMYCNKTFNLPSVLRKHSQMGHSELNLRIRKEKSGANKVAPHQDGDRYRAPYSPTPKALLQSPSMSCSNHTLKILQYNC